MKKTTTILFAVVTVAVLGALLFVYVQGGSTTGTVTTKLTVRLYDAPAAIHPGNTTTWTKVDGAWTSSSVPSDDNATVWVFEGIVSRSNCYDQLAVASAIAGFNVTAESQPLGLIVTSIAGDENLEHGGRAWQYFVNGVYANRASNVYAIAEGATVEWKYIPNQMS